MSNGGKTVTSPHLARTFRRLTIGVTIASGLVSGICGAYAPSAYSIMSSWKLADVDRTLFPQYAGPAGVAFGTVGGVAAGLLWSYLMRRFSMRSLERQGSLPSMAVTGGAALGLMVAFVATVFVHVGLAALSGFRLSPEVLAGLCIGAPAGVVLGAACGAVWMNSVEQALQQADLDADPSSSATSDRPPSAGEPPR